MSERPPQSEPSLEALSPAEQLNALRKEAFDFLTEVAKVSEDEAEQRLEKSMGYYRNLDPQGENPETLERFKVILSHIKNENEVDSAGETSVESASHAEAHESEATSFDFDGDPRHLSEELFSAALAHNDENQLHVKNFLELMSARHTAIKSFLSTAKLSFQTASEQGVESDGYTIEDYRRDQTHLKRFLTKIAKREDEPSGSYERIDPQHAKLLFRVWERLFEKSDGLMEALQRRSEQTPSQATTETVEQKDVSVPAGEQSHIERDSDAAPENEVMEVSGEQPEVAVRHASYQDIERLAAKLNHVPLEYQTYFAGVLGRMNLLLRDIEREGVDPELSKQKNQEFNELALQLESEVSDFAPKMETDEAHARELVEAVEAEEVPEQERMPRPNGVSNEVVDPAYERIYGQWKETRKEADEIAKEYSERLKKHYDSYYEVQGQRSVFNPKKFGVGIKGFFGIKPSLTPELQELKQREESLQGQYAALGGRLVELRSGESVLADERKYKVTVEVDGKKVEKEIDMSVVERYERMLERKLALKPIQERIDMQKQAMESMPQNQTFRAMREVMSKNKYTILAGKAVLFGTLGAVSGGVITGSVAALRVGAGFAGGVVGGTIGHRAMQGRVDRAEVISRSLIDKRMSKLSAEELRNRRAELIEAYSIKDRRQRQQRIAAVAGAIIGGGAAARFGPELYETAADKIYDAHQRHLFVHTHNEPYGVGAEPAEVTNPAVQLDELDDQPAISAASQFPEMPDLPDLPREGVLDAEPNPVVPEPPIIDLPEGEPRAEWPGITNQGPFEYGDEHEGVIQTPHYEPTVPEYVPDENPAWADPHDLTEPSTEGVIVSPETASELPEQAVEPVEPITAEELSDVFKFTPRTPLDYTSLERIENQEHLFELGHQYGQSTVSEQVYEAWKDGAFEHLQWVPSPDEISKQEFLDTMNRFIDPNSPDALSAAEIRAMDIESGDFTKMPYGDQYDAVPLLDKMFPPNEVLQVEMGQPAGVSEQPGSVERPQPRIAVSVPGGATVEVVPPVAEAASAAPEVHFDTLPPESPVTASVFYDPAFHQEVVEHVSKAVDDLPGVTVDGVMNELEARMFPVEGTVAGVGEIHELIRGVASREHVLNSLAPQGNSVQMDAFTQLMSETAMNSDIAVNLGILNNTGYNVEQIVLFMEAITEHFDASSESLSKTLAENIESLFADGTLEFTPDHKGIMTADGKPVFRFTS